MGKKLELNSKNFKCQTNIKQEAKIDKAQGLV